MNAFGYYLYIEDTPYEGGAFRMKLVLGHDFPASPPQGILVVVMWHVSLGLCRYELMLFVPLMHRVLHNQNIPPQCGQ